MTADRRGPVHTLVDAHNLIHADAGLRALAGDPAAARAALARRLDGTARMHLVCDGGPGGIARTVLQGTVIMVYSGTASADDAIVRWLRERADARAVVVSDDRELIARARSLGAREVRCRLFLRGLQARGEAANDPRRGPPPAHEVEMWMKTFGIEDEEAR